MRFFVCSLLSFHLLLFSLVQLSAQPTIVASSEDLSSLLKQDRELGTIILTNGIYTIDALDVKAGGNLQAAPSVRPIIVGKGIYIQKSGELDEFGYWKKKIDAFERCDFFLFDDSFQAIPISGVESGVRNLKYLEKEIVKLDSKERKIRIPIKEEYSYLQGKDKAYFHFTTMKLSCWFVCMDVTGLYSDDKYIYGYVDSDYNYSKIGRHDHMFSYLTLFNYPVNDGSAYIDGQGYIHVPRQYNKVYLSKSESIFNLQGKRKLAFSGISFKGSMYPIKMGNNSRNKSFDNCVFDYCGTGIEFKNYVENAEGNMTIENCRFSNLYSNYAIYILPVDNIHIKNNMFSHTGILNKGGSVISVNGKNFLIEDNSIEDFSYNGISCGVDEKYSYKTIEGVIKNNIVDNRARYGDSSTQLYDSGAIYIYTHNNSLLIENNIIRNIGFENGSRFGLYLDDGAYNVAVKNNLIYNMYPGQEAVHARFVGTISSSCINNSFEGNIVIGDSIFGGNANGRGKRTVLSNNYFSGHLSLSNTYVDDRNSKKIRVIVQDGKVFVDRRSKLKKKEYSKNIRSVLNTSKTVNE